MPDPLLLGRSVVVAPGAAPPAPWAACPRVTVSAVEPELADRLGQAWRRRQALAIELVPGLGLDDPTRPPAESVSGRQPWEWPVDLDLPGERLHHGLWANAVDARGATPCWHWADVARRLGAVPAGPGAPGDVVLPDGTPALVDGGPLDASLPGRAGMAVVHRVALEHGSLRPIGPPGPAGVDLAPDQLAAVAEPGAGARVIAPAGSGKTRVLTERVRLLLARWGIPAAAVTVVAFNVRAADELRSRLGDLGEARIRTLNALGLRLCGDRTTIDEPAARRILDDLVTFPRRSETDPAAPWLEALSRVRLGLADPGTVEEEVGDVSDLDRVARAYRARLADRGEVDFDEQVVGAVERLLADPGFRHRSQRHARLLLVDEFQDLTPAHLLLLRLLLGPAGSVFAVGDDDQTIYGYAGATPRWLVDLDAYVPGVVPHALEVNYRCPPAVVRAAANLLTRNALRVPKTIRPALPAMETVPVDAEPGASASGAGASGAGDEALVTLAGAAGPASRTAERVRQLLAAGAAPGDVAVLARVNASLAPVQVLLRHHGVPVSGGVDDRFLRRGGVRAALAWLAVAGATGGALPGAVLRDAARHPRRGMSMSLLDLVARQRSLDALASLADWLAGKGSDREAGKVRDLADDVALVQQAAAGADTLGVLQAVRTRVGGGGLDATAEALDQWGRGQVASHGDDLDALSELATLHPDPCTFGAWLAAHLGRQVGDGVTLASVHAVKGREWPHVVVHHVTDGLLPHRLVADVEEERRVFHVALTRGRTSVALVPGEPPSPFLDELARPGRPVAGRTAAVGRRDRGSPGQGERPGRGARGAPDPSPVPGRARRGAVADRSPASGRAPDAELLPAVVGTAFELGGQPHEVTATADDAVQVRIGGGRARTAVRYGTVVAVEGRPALLAHPRAADAWTELRAWRTRQATDLGKPAFVVFDDRTLRQLAAVLPTTEAALLAVSGIGPAKAERFGDDLLALADALRA